MATCWQADCEPGRRDEDEAAPATCERRGQAAADPVGDLDAPETVDFWEPWDALSLLGRWG